MDTAIYSARTFDGLRLPDSMSLDRAVRQLALDHDVEYTSLDTQMWGDSEYDVYATEHGARRRIGVVHAAAL